MLNAPLRAGKHQAPRLCSFVLEWRGWRPTGTLDFSRPMSSWPAEHTMTPHVADRRMAVLFYLAPVWCSFRCLRLNKCGNVNKNREEEAWRWPERCSMSHSIGRGVASRCDDRRLFKAYQHHCSVWRASFVRSKQADASAVITLLGTDAPRAGRCHATALRHSSRILFLDPQLRR